MKAWYVEYQTQTGHASCIVFGDWHWPLDLGRVLIKKEVTEDDQSLPLHVIRRLYGELS